VWEDSLHKARDTCVFTNEILFLQMSRAKAIKGLLSRDGLNVDAVASLVLDYSEFAFVEVAKTRTFVFHGSVIGELADGRVVERTAIRELRIAGKAYMNCNVITNVVVLDKHFAALTAGGPMILFNGEKNKWEPLNNRFSEAVALAACNNRLASFHEESVLQTWDLATREAIRSVQTKVNKSYLTELALSPNGELAAVAADPCIQIVSTTTGVQAVALAGHTQSILELKFISDVKLASCDRASTFIWNVVTGGCLHSLGDERSRVLSLDVLSCGHLVAIDVEGKANVWDSETGEVIFQKNFVRGCEMFRSRTGGLVAQSQRHLCFYE